jgi:hypothetical protein
MFQVELAGNDRSASLITGTASLEACWPLSEGESAMMIVQNDTTACAVCGNVPAVIFCDGCHIPLCQDCRTFDLWGTAAPRGYESVLTPVSRTSISIPTAEAYMMQMMPQKSLKREESEGPVPETGR